MLEEIYILILKFTKECYPEADTSSNIDIKSLTWQLDGKTIEERVQSYCTYAINTLSLGLNEEELVRLKELLIYNFIRIIETEDKMILNQTLKRRIAKYYNYVMIFSGQCKCCQFEDKIQPIENLNKWPPLHPMCNCVPILFKEKEE